MKQWQRLALILIGCVALAALLGLRIAFGPPPSAYVGSAASDAPVAVSGPVWSSAGKLRARENAEHHWRKHEREFPELHSAADYIAAAHKFIQSPPPGTLTKREADGDMLFYNPASNIFAVRARNGAPRTMFKPDNGMRYWERQ